MEEIVSEEQQKPKRKLPSVFYNITTLVGVGLALISFGLIVFLFVLEHYSQQSHPYMGLITFIGLPFFLLIGLFVATFGLLRAHRRAKRGLPESRLPKIDLNIPRHRFALTMIGFTGIAFMVASGFGSYQAFEYTESVDFCGLVCHNVMKPEFVAYQNSPHARVACAQCHIGSGAEWYVRSKLSGAYQVYSYIFNKYSRPIPTPIHNLRPAKETCEQCHSPGHFYSQKLKDRTYFLSDENNSKYQITMLMKIGGRQYGTSEGIHAHMYLDKQIKYIATDRQRMVIPYVEATGKDGSITVYRSTDEPITDAQLKTSEKRVVDCIDCHNRPSHIFRNPAKSVDLSLAQGQIDAKIPEIKSVAVEELDKPYKTENEALSSLRKSILDYYAKNHPKEAVSKAKEIEAAIKAVQAIYSLNYFPEMKVSWRAFPSQTDHIYSLGCFRCHDDKHVSASGKVISKDCNSCHTILSQQGPDGKKQFSMSGLEFKHPVDIGDAWKTTPCKDCHAPTPEQ